MRGAPRNPLCKLLTDDEILGRKLKKMGSNSMDNNNIDVCFR